MVPWSNGSIRVFVPVTVLLLLVSEKSPEVDDQSTRYELASVTAFQETLIPLPSGTAVTPVGASSEARSVTADTWAVGVPGGALLRREITLK